MTQQLSWNIASAAVTKEIFELAEGQEFDLKEILDVFDLFVLTWGSSEAPLWALTNENLGRHGMENLSKENLWKSLGAIAIGWGRGNGHLIFEETVAATLIKKQHDYGHKNIARFGFIGLLIRVHDKIARLENLISKEANPNNESIDDTIMDIVGYSAIGMMWERNQFMLDLETNG